MRRLDDIPLILWPRTFNAFQSGARCRRHRCGAAFRSDNSRASRRAESGGIGIVTDSA